MHRPKKTCVYLFQMDSLSRFKPTSKITDVNWHAAGETTELGEVSVIVPSSNVATSMPHTSSETSPCKNGGCKIWRSSRDGNSGEPRSENPWHSLKTVFLVSVIVAFLLWVIVYTLLDQYQIIWRWLSSWSWAASVICRIGSLSFPRDVVVVMIYIVIVGSRNFSELAITSNVKSHGFMFLIIAITYYVRFYDLPHSASVVYETRNRVFGIENARDQRSEKKSALEETMCALKTLYLKKQRVK